MLTKDTLFKKLCELTATIPFGYDPKIYSIRYLSSVLKATKYIVTKNLKLLENDGLVAKTYEGGITDEGLPYCHHGWTLTDKALLSGTYQLYDEKAKTEIERFLNA